MKLYIYNSDSWLLLAHHFETLDWYKNNFSTNFQLYEANKHSLPETAIIKVLKGRLEYNIYANGEIKIKKSSVITEANCYKISSLKLEVA